MDTPPPFKWRNFEAEIVVLCVRWYLRYSFSYRDLEEMMAERVCLLTTRRSTAGSSTMLLSWRSAADLISKSRQTPGALTKPT